MSDEFKSVIDSVQSQVPFSGVCAHLRDLRKNGTGTYHWEATGICLQTSELWQMSGVQSLNQSWMEMVPAC